jgi:uncharacterized protein (TIGR01777 family)
MRVVVTGTSGLIGSALVPALRADGHEILALVRREPRRADEIQWDPAAGRLDPGALAGVDAAVHLAGAGVGDRRWTDAYKKTIRDSRVLSTQLLAERLAGLEPRPKVLVSASGMGIYGDSGDVPVDETAPAGSSGFLAGVAQEWEAATAVAADAGIRVCHLRTGLVLSSRGGAMARMLPLFKLGVGGKLGSGRQWWSWVSLADEIGVIRFLLDADGVRGPVNVVSPNPVTNAEFVQALGRAVHRPSLLPVPAFALKAVLGEFSSEILDSLRVVPGVLTKAGYPYVHPELDRALAAVVARQV